MIYKIFGYIKPYIGRTFIVYMSVRLGTFGNNILELDDTKQIKYSNITRDVTLLYTKVEYQSWKHNSKIYVRPIFVYHNKKLVE